MSTEKTTTRDERIRLLKSVTLEYMERAGVRFEKDAPPLLGGVLNKDADGIKFWSVTVNSDDEVCIQAGLATTLSPMLILPSDGTGHDSVCHGIKMAVRSLRRTKKA